MSFTGSQPNLTALKDDDTLNRATPRKRKNPHEFDAEEFKRDIEASLSGMRKDIQGDIRHSLSEFRDNMTKLLENTIAAQNETIKRLTLSNDKLIEENKQIHKVIDELKSENTIISSKLLSLENKILTADKAITDVTAQLLYKEQLSRMNNLELSGIPQSKSENLVNILHTISTKVGISISPSDIDHIHRVRRYPSQNRSADVPSQVANIIVRFTRPQKKYEMLSAVKARRGITTVDLNFDGPALPIYINEHLAPHNKMLYNQARRLGKDCGYAYIWLKECKIFLRKNDSSKPIFIANECDLSKIK